MPVKQEAKNYKYQPAHRLVTNINLVAQERKVVGARSVVETDPGKIVELAEELRQVGVTNFMEPGYSGGGRRDDGEF